MVETGHLKKDIQTAHAFFQNLLTSERGSLVSLRAYQSGLLDRLLHHAYHTVPFYRDSLSDHFSNGAGNPIERWSRLPFTNRETITRHGSSLVSEAIPSNHGICRYFQSGGSTGEPIRIAATELSNMARVTASYRMYDWFNLDCSLPLATIKPLAAFSGVPESITGRKWGFPWKPESELGERIHIDPAIPIADQVNRLCEYQQIYVDTIPSSILKACFEVKDTLQRPSIPTFITAAEKITADVTHAAYELFGSRTIDVFASAEGGVIALQCPTGEQHHIQSELAYVEILNREGRNCEVGEIGEIVVTSLYNYAMPLIRYRTGDIVMCGETCRCGRTLPTFSKILGRADYLFLAEDGSFFCPAIDRFLISTLVGHLDWKLVQVGSQAAEFRHAGPGLGEEIRNAIHQEIDGNNPTFDLRFVSSRRFSKGIKQYFLTRDWLPQEKLNYKATVPVA